MITSLGDSTPLGGTGNARLFPFPLQFCSSRRSNLPVPFMRLSKMPIFQTFSKSLFVFVSVSTDTVNLIFSTWTRVFSRVYSTQSTSISKISMLPVTLFQCSCTCSMMAFLYGTTPLVDPSLLYSVFINLKCARQLVDGLRPVPDCVASRLT